MVKQGPQMEVYYQPCHPGMLTVPSGVFFTTLGLGTEQAGATGKMYTNSTSNWAPIPTEGLSTLGRTPAGPSVVINAFTGDAPGQSMISTITWAVGTCCVFMNMSYL